jgi:cytochrome c biogenesis protein CcdA
VDRSALYSTIATMLPIFALALLVERRIGPDERSTSPTTDALLALSVLTMCALGEFSAFVGLADGPSHGATTTSELAMGTAGVLLIADIASSVVGAHAEHDESSQHRRGVAIAAGVLIVLSALALILFGVGAIFGV